MREPVIVEIRRKIFRAKARRSPAVSEFGIDSINSVVSIMKKRLQFRSGRGAARAVAVACLLGARTADAAEIRMDPSREHPKGAVLEGKIEAGDFDKFKSSILNGENVVEIYLASPGGNLGEAMKIGLLIRTLRLSTVVPSRALTNQAHNGVAAQHNLKDPAANYMCASACFFIFVAGVHRSSDNSGPAILGIHRPTVSASDLKRLSLDQVTAADNQARTAVKNYLTAMDVPAKYAENMYSVPMHKIQWIRFDEFQADLHGFIPEVRAWVGTRCGDSTDVEKKGWEESQRKLDCETNVQEELAFHAYGDALKKQNNASPQTIPDNVLPLSPR
jgi:hypothetical protein